MLRIEVCSVFVDDQEKALAFYTETLGFLPKTDEPAGEFRWLTVVSADDPDGTELLLEPNANPAATTFQQALFDQGIPATMFAVDDLDAEYERLSGLGVEFTSEPAADESGKSAILDDTCGNLILLHETV